MCNNCGACPHLETKFMHCRLEDKKEKRCFKILKKFLNPWNIFSRWEFCQESLESSILKCMTDCKAMQRFPTHSVKPED